MAGIAEHVVDELLRCLVGAAFFGHYQERAGDGVAAVLDGFGAAFNAVYLQGFDIGAHGVVGNVADGCIVALDGLDDAAGGIHHAGDKAFIHIFQAEQLFHSAARAGARFTIEHGDLLIRAADLVPVGDFAAEDFGELVFGQVIDRVVGVDHGDDAVVGDGGGG